MAKALDGPTAAVRKGALADALLFRNERYRRFSGAGQEENALEMNEGVAEYTGVRAGLTMPEARIAYVIRDLSAVVQSPSFVRSFAYATGPAYGLMLDQANPAWRRKLGTGQRLDQMLSGALHLSPPAFESLATRHCFYDDGTLRTFDLQRDRESKARLAALKAKLVDGAVLTLPLSHASYQFNPRTLQPLGEAGTVYPT